MEEWKNGKMEEWNNELYREIRKLNSN